MSGAKPYSWVHNQGMELRSSIGVVTELMIVLPLTEDVRNFVTDA